MPPSRVATQATVCADSIIRVLMRTLLERRPADRCLRDEFYANRQFGSRDRRLISETLFSILRWWGWLRYAAPSLFIDAWKSHETQMPAVPRELWYHCLVGAWVLDYTPDIPEAVNLWRRTINVSPKVFDDASGDSFEDCSFLLEEFMGFHELKYSELLPDWAYDFANVTDKQTRRTLVAWHQRRPPVWIRGQLADSRRLIEQLAEEEVKVRPHERVPLAFRVLPTSTNLRATESFRHGDFEIQDLSSQATALLCHPRPGQQWWDACAGGGGKTLHLAWLMQGKGSVLATDIRLHKLEELRLRARRAQFPNIRCKEWKGKDMPTFRDRFDGVLVDAPCSCSGTWRRNPGARWTTTPEDVAGCVILQKQLLENAAPAVKPGGLLVYSTCSMFPTENEEVVKAFLEVHPEFALEPDCNPLTGARTNGFCLIHHQDGDCDSMFTARLRRKAKGVSAPNNVPETDRKQD